ncbi:S8 family peptidase [Streptomyces sp. NPDC052236]|uniref:S8 family peptidase n=1 Tax=Streptomyces sp. NPDC052236 TaxID=3365686 RepID=UPI0037D4BD8D
MAVAVTALALTAGLTTPVLAAAPAETKPGDTATATGTATATATATRWITLLTGDTVAVDAKGKPVQIVHGKGRESIPISIQRTNDSTLVIPHDAQRLINEGRVDARLFDVAELGKAEYRKRERTGLPLIVSYEGSGSKSTQAKASEAAKSRLRANDAAKVDRSFPRLNADTVSVPAKETESVWETLIDASGSGTAPGIERIWLDSIQKASLDKSVPQIGAPEAWAKGYDGKGVRIAVLDTGVDETHPDLQGRQEAEQNFSDAADAKDRVGHGTHVASIAAGTGAKSEGKYRGVAPGARILDGKVLDDKGNGWTSGVLAGVEWAAAQNADVINLSLGGPDTPELDPLEEAVNKLSAERGILFVTAAGNSGPKPGSIGSPGSADAALTVAAVEKNDFFAGFSGRGPRLGDGALKPDITAPGVNIVAASAPGSIIAEQEGEDPPGYVALSGTSMATPHVAGAAALLKQQHPDWTSRELKAALANSAKPGDADVFAQGNGRVDVAAALKATVIAEPASVSFGTQSYPHTDDEPVTKKVTYRNLGSEPISLDLSITTVGPDGKPAIAGMFTLAAQQVTVPAGGTAEVDLTADTRLGGDLDGEYGATVTATGGGQTIRTAAAVERQVASYLVTVNHVDRNGKPSDDYVAAFSGLTGPGTAKDYADYDSDGSYTVRVPKGVYVLGGTIWTLIGDDAYRSDRIYAPNFVVSEDTTVTLDARTTKPVNVTGPDPAAASRSATTYFDLVTPGLEFMSGHVTASFENYGSAHLGPELALADSTLYEQFRTNSEKDSKEYQLAYGGLVTRLASGYQRHAEAGDLAEVTVRSGASVPGKTGWLLLMPQDDGSNGSSLGTSRSQQLPAVTTSYVNTAGTTWEFWLEQRSNNPFTLPETMYQTEPKTYEAGKRYRQDLGIGVFGPTVGNWRGVFREGDAITGCLPFFADSDGSTGQYSASDAGKTTLYREGVEVGSVAEPMDCQSKPFRVTADKANYRLTSTATRRDDIAATSTEVTATWTFNSQQTTARTALPISVVRFTPRLDADSTAKAGALTKVPITVQGPAAGKNLKSLTIEASYDGKTWKKVPVIKGAMLVLNPKAGQGISFRATLSDKQGNTLTQTIRNAYLGK